MDNSEEMWDGIMEEEKRRIEQEALQERERIRVAEQKNMYQHMLNSKQMFSNFKEARRAYKNVGELSFKEELAQCFNKLNDRIVESCDLMINFWAGDESVNKDMIPPNLQKESNE